MHVGALLGTIMSANVFFVIIPSQKALVKAAAEGTILDPSLGEKAGLRSLHNNYFTLPVIFVMISTHFPSTFGNEFNWAVLAGLSLVSIGIKHFWNVYERGVVIKWILPAAVISLIGLALVTAPENRSQMLKDAAIVNIYGGMHRDERKKNQDTFKNDKNTLCIFRSRPYLKHFLDRF